jgi:tyrosine decarboxylase/aspartate 1-decarboxylase
MQKTTMMPKNGLPQETIIQELETRLQQDLTYSSGKILCSMCTSPHNFSKKIYHKYLEKNLGDPNLFPASIDLEQEAISMLGSLLSNPKACGSIVSGGTEANIIALWAARNLAKKECGEVIVPVSAHYSFDKACNLLNLKLIKIKLNSGYQMDLKSLEKAITSKTVAIVGLAGSTGLGMVDPLNKISEIASEHDVYFHVDAAFGGFMLPFFRELGYKPLDFDFSLPTVCSITIDPHKMGLAPIPAGGILFRTIKISEVISMEVPYLAGGEINQSTLLGTRSGAAAIAVWALLKHLGKEGYAAVVKRCLRLTWKFVEEIQRIDELDTVVEPTLNVVGVKSERIDIRLIFHELKKRGWAVSLFLDYLRIVIMPHTLESHIKNFIEDLQKIINNLKT